MRALSDGWVTPMAAAARLNECNRTANRNASN